MTTKPDDGARTDLRDVRFGRRKLHECDGPDDVTYHEHVAILPDGSKVSLVDFIASREKAAVREFAEKAKRELSLISRLSQSVMRETYVECVSIPQMEKYFDDLHPEPTNDPE